MLINKLEKGGFLKRFPKASAPIQTLFCGFVLIFATPLGCAFFSQRAAINVSYADFVLVTILSFLKFQKNYKILGRQFGIGC